jgi:hypothetical protein
MHKYVTDTQGVAITNVLSHAMSILRGDKQFMVNDESIGNLISARRMGNFAAIEYVYENRNLPESEITLVAYADPANHTKDSAQVAMMPDSFKLYFYGVVSGIAESSLKTELDLADYWINSDGEQRRNDMLGGMPPAVRLHSYRYRANLSPGSRFPLDVEIFFVDPSDDDPSGTQELNSITIRRVYPTLTPGPCKQKLEEKTHPKHANSDF